MSTEKNINEFNKDVEANAGYLYSTGAKLSSRIANKRLSDAVRQSVSLTGKRVIDVGCGDGVYTVELLNDRPKSVLGIDPAETAVESARRRSAGFDNIEYKIADIYHLDSLNDRFDVAIVRGVLHHLYDAEKAIANLSKIADEIVVIEPNGYCPILKVIEKVSKYHRVHEEKSYPPHRIDKWFALQGAKKTRSFYCGVVPMFCPDTMARVLKILEPIVEKTPVLRELLCAVYVLKVRN